MGTTKRRHPRHPDAAMQKMYGVMILREGITRVIGFEGLSMSSLPSAFALKLALALSSKKIR
jgi:hypothetical protein